MRLFITYDGGGGDHGRQPRPGKWLDPAAGEARAFAPLFAPARRQVEPRPP